MLQDNHKTDLHTVFNLGTGAELVYVGTTAKDALVSAAIYQNNEVGNLLNPITRARYEKMIIIGRYGFSINDLAVKF